MNLDHPLLGDAPQDAVIPAGHDNDEQECPGWTACDNSFMDSGRGDAHIATAAWLLADDTRATFCTALLDGRFWTAGELASCASVTAGAASEQLARLVAGGMLEVVGQGRHRYFRLAGPELVSAVAAQVAGLPPRTVRGPRPSPASLALRDGRTCYGHLAGRLGIALTGVLADAGVITADFGLGDVSVLAPLGITAATSGSQPAVRPCVDWTQRRYHAAGTLPTAITSRLLALDWLRRPDHSRAIRLTKAGQGGLADLLHTSLSDLAVGQAA
jgi:DNA-binding transcriptional ArsR family regulator